ncbi:MAG: PhoX family protein [Burkholderiaceae bacterium]
MNAMTHAEQVALEIDPEEICTNPQGGPEFLDITKARLDRRGFLRTTSGGAAMAAIGSVGLSACGGSDDPAPVAGPSRIAALSFPAVNKSQADRVSVPTGYTQRAFYRTGDPTAAGTAAYTNLGTDDAATYATRAGDHHDGIEYFGLNNAGTAADPIAGNSRGILGMNHETTTAPFLHANGGTPAVYTLDANGNGYIVATARPQNEVDREVAMHGVSIIEVQRTNAAGAISDTGTWNYVQASAFNRRITAATPIEISGPLRGHPSMITKFSPTGTRTRGTVNNCGTGYSFWGTLLTNEENWAGYTFRDTTNDNAARGGATSRAVVSFNRYGIGTATGATGRTNFNNDRFSWASLAATTAAGMAANAVGSVGDLNDRWNANLVAADRALDYANVPNTFGWVVEIDPYNPAAAPRKRTAMGRFAHEAAVMNAPVVGQPIAVYMGDDSRGDYIYKFVSTALWDAADGTSALTIANNRMALGDKYLDSGTLYAARFNTDGTGNWLPLTITNAAIAAATTPYQFSDQADVLLNARLAGDVVGATRMDRPEWGSVNALTRDIYFTMTEANAGAGNTGRRADNLNGPNPRFYSDVRDATATTTTTTNSGNTFGHIVRLGETGNNPGSTTFNWDVYLFGSQADADPARVNLSGLTTDNDFARCDGMWFSRSTNICWIQTDDSGAFLDQSNCMMLAALPGSRGDGTVNAGVAASAALVGSTPAGAVLGATRVGAPVTTSTLRRFLVGPRDSEITGVTDTPDGRTMFVNIQHPGENTAVANIAAGAGDFSSYYPVSERAPGSAPTVGGARPRSSTIVITRDNGGIVGGA